jgi:hypothetical protein
MLSNYLAQIGNEEGFITTNQRAIDYTGNVALNGEINKLIWWEVSISAMYDFAGYGFTRSREESHDCGE